MKHIFVFLLSFLLVVPAFAAIQTKMIEYKDGDTVLEGYIAYDDAIIGSRPGVLVVHDWMGFGPFGNNKAQEMAKLGYVGFAVDIYGKGVRPQNTDEASAQSSIYKNDSELLRRRILAGFRAIKELEIVDAEKIAVIGFCFGGTTALEMVRSGAPIAGAVSFHGGLSTPMPISTTANNIQAKVLVLHGADDPYVPPQEVKTFEKEMNDANVDWQMIHYSGAVHSFTNPDAGSDNSKGAAYNASADKRSWVAMKSFFNEIFN